MIFRNRVANAREERAMSRQELADLVGITRQSIGLIESGRVSPSTAVSLRLSRVLGYPVEQLFFEDEQTITTRFVSEPGDVISAPTRAYVSTIRGEFVSRPASWLGSMSLQVPAQGVAETLPNELSQAQVRLLESQDEITRTVFISGCDLGLALLANHTRRVSAGYQGLWFNVSNRKALDEVKHGVTHVAVVHYPTERVEHLKKMCPIASRLYQFASSEMGWLVKKGNPSGFSDVSDLEAGRLRLINRDIGAGARELLDTQLVQAGISSSTVQGYDNVVHGHVQVAEAIVNHIADVGIGHSAAAVLYDLTFIPLRAETSWIIVPDDALEHKPVHVLLDALNTGSFQRQLQSFGPYDVRQIGSPV